MIVKNILLSTERLKSVVFYFVIEATEFIRVHELTIDPFNVQTKFCMKVLALFCSRIL